MNREEENQLIFIAAQYEAMCQALDGEEVSDFMLSCPDVRRVWDLAHSKEVERLQAKNAAMLTVLEEVDECSRYWSEYDVPLGLHERIKAAIAEGRGEA